MCKRPRTYHYGDLRGTVIDEAIRLLDAWERLGPSQARMSPRNRGTPKGFSLLAAPLLVAAMRRANRNDLPKPKALLAA